MRTLDALSAEHQEVFEKLNLLEKRIEKTEEWESTSATAKDFSRFFKESVLLHFRVEEEALFPVLGRIIGFEGGPISVMLMEHGYLKTKFAEFEGALKLDHPEDKSSRRKFAEVSKEVIENLRSHAQKEDYVLFPMARRVLNENQLKEIDKLGSKICPHIG